MPSNGVVKGRLACDTCERDPFAARICRKGVLKARQGLDWVAAAREQDETIECSRLPCMVQQTQGCLDHREVAPMDRARRMNDGYSRESYDPTQGKVRC
jgi:hypothetical protein